MHGLKVAKEISIRQIQCFGDSDLVVQQVSGNWDAKDANMASYRFLVQQISGYFEGCEFLHIRRDDNEVADMLSKLGSYRKPIPPEISVEHLRKPSIKPDPNSLSIFVPADPTSANAATDDKGKGKAVIEDSGTAPANPGTSQSLMVYDMPEYPGTTQ